MKRPSFQFYPGDWSANPNLKRCTFAERGIWLEVMCLMHDQDPYGVLRWPLKEIAQAVGCKPADLMALARKGVLKGADDHLAEAFVYTPRSGRKDGEPVTLIDTQAGPIWFSSRMVKDEYLRTIRGDGGGNGDAPKRPPKATPKGAPKPPIGEGIGGGFGPRGSSSPSSASLGEIANALSPGEISPAAAVCIALKAAGIPGVNPGHPRLQALLDAGATLQNFEAMAPKSSAAGDRFAYVLASVEAELKRAAAIPKTGKHAGFASKDYTAGVNADGSLA